MKQLFRLFILISTVLFVMSVFSGMAQATPTEEQTALQAAPMDEVALQYVADRYQVAKSDLKIGARSETNYQNVRMQVFEYKVLNMKTGEVFVAELDTAGNEVNASEIATLERDLYRERNGNLDYRVVEMLEAGVGEMEVMLWLVNPDPEFTEGRPDPEAALSEADQEAFMEASVAGQRERTARITDPVLRRIHGMDAEAVAGDLVAVINAKLTAEDIREISGWAEIDTVYLAPVYESEMYWVRRAVKANWVNFLGYTGAGVKLGEVEVGGRASALNPYLSFTQGTPGTTCLSDHSTGVAGIIASTHTNNKGIAYGASLWVGGSCYGADAQLQAAAAAAGTWGARAINNSWGAAIGLVPGAFDRYFDAYTLNSPYVAIVKSAGNRGLGDGHITSPGLGYNVISVGSYYENNNILMSDDVISSFSSYVDPTSSHGDREKPEIVAPGDVITSTTTTAPWFGPIGSGTSYAAPVVTGGIGLMLDRNSGMFYWPEAMKAVLMATAINNVHGNPVGSTGLTPAIGEKDGAGGINLKYADYVAAKVSWWGKWGTMGYSCSTPQIVDVPLNLTAGKPARVVIVWDQNPDYLNYATKPSADIDMLILNPGGAIVAYSTKWDNTYEIVHFNPVVSGTYTLRIWKTRCDLTPKYLAWALYHH